jgi:hypothetical protein
MCCAISRIPSPEKITPETPLRLNVAAALAFPDGSMTAAGLKRNDVRESRITPNSGTRRILHRGTHTPAFEGKK